MNMEDKAFRIVKEFDAATIEMSSSPGIWEVVAGDIGYQGDGWKALANNAFYWTDTLDLHGITRQERTLFFSNNMLQRPWPYLTTVTPPASGSGLGYSIIDQMVVSDIPLDSPTATTAPWSQTAGYSDTKDDYMSVKLGQGFLASSTDSSPKALPIVDSWSFGGNDPTASNRLYLYRWIHILSVTGTVFAQGEQIGFPNYRYVGSGISTTEPDLVWIMRLRRSFEEVRVNN